MAENKTWERLGSEKLLENPYFIVRSDKLKLPDGAVKDPYYVIERPDAAIVFPVTEGGGRGTGTPVQTTAGEHGVGITGGPR